MSRTGGPAKIEILPDAARYILEHGGHVFIRPSPRHGCCGGKAYVPVVDLGESRASGQYQNLILGDVSVHLHKEVEFTARLVIGIDGIWKWQKLWIEGTQITM